jgi:hypothetical protein
MFRRSQPATLNVVFVYVAIIVMYVILQPVQSCSSRKARGGSRRRIMDSTTALALAALDSKTKG